MRADEHGGLGAVRQQQHGGLRQRFRLAGAERSVDDERRRVALATRQHVTHDLELLVVQDVGATQSQCQR